MCIDFADLFTTATIFVPIEGSGPAALICLFPGSDLELGQSITAGPGTDADGSCSRRTSCRSTPNAVCVVPKSHELLDNISSAVTKIYIVNFLSQAEPLCRYIDDFLLTNHCRV